jgi:hypothetical protein
MLGIGIALFITVTPYVYYRSHYAYAKRLRVVTEGKVYRSGCNTADGFEAAIRRYGIKFVLNLQEEDADPNLPATFWSSQRERESELCKRLGVKYRFLQLDLLPPDQVPSKKPQAIAKAFEIFDNRDNYPILIHCKAGLHRTGVLVALYRMEYDGWTVYEALEEMRSNGFGRMPSYSPNEYIRQYLANYERREDVRHEDLLSQQFRSGPMREEWRGSWFREMPAHLTPERVHGGILP